MGDEASLRRRRNKENCERMRARRLCFKPFRGARLPLSEFNKQMWRNWQTRWIQVPVRAISYGFESLHLHHKETIILIRKISVLWLFYCKNRGSLPFFIGFIAQK